MTPTDVVGIIVVLLFSATTFYKKEWGLYLFVFLLPLYLIRVDIPVLGVGRNPALSLSELLFYILAAGIVIRNWRTVYAKTKELFTDERPLFIGASYIIMGVLVGMWQSNDALQTLGILRGWVIAPITLFFITRTLNFNKEYIIRALAASSSTVGLASFLAPSAFNLEGRLQGFYGSPNYLAMYLAPLLPLLIYEVFKSIKEKNLFTTALWVACCVVTVAAIFFSFSQGAWLGIGAVLAIAALWHAKKKFSTKTVIVASFVIILFIEFVGQSFLQDFVTSSLQSRVGLWEAAWNIGVDHPFFGIGAGMFPEAYKIQKHTVLYPVGLETALHPHNVFLAFWLYGGLLGIMGFGTILFWLAKKLYSRVVIKDQKNAVFYSAIAAAFIIVLVHGLVDTTYWKNDLAFMWWILVAIGTDVPRRITQT